MEDSPSFSPHLEVVSNDASLTEQLQELFEHLVHEVITHILAGLRGGPAEQTQWLADEQERVHVALSLRSGRLGGVPLGHKPHDLEPVPVQCVPYKVGPPLIPTFARVPCRQAARHESGDQEVAGADSASPNLRDE